MKAPKDPGKGKPPDMTVRVQEISPSSLHGSRGIDKLTEEKLSQDSIVPETQQSDEEMEDLEQNGTTNNANQESKRDNASKGDEEECPNEDEEVYPDNDEGDSAEEPGAQRNETQASSNNKVNDNGESHKEEASKQSRMQADRKLESQDVAPKEMFEAVVEEMKKADSDQPRTAWIMTICELYNIVHGKVKLDEDLIPAGKQRYPKLKSEEKTLLFKMFKETCVLTPGQYEDWERYALAATQELYNTNRSFKTIMYGAISKVKWANTKPLNQWAAKVKATDKIQEGDTGTTTNVETYQDFMFNPAMYNRQDIERLRELCEQPAAATTGRQLRSGTADEWGIIGGMAEGTIVCRRKPDFLKSILDSKERLRLHRTIQSQVEGELLLQLRGGTIIRESRQHTQAIQEDIRVAAEAMHTNTPDLRKMLSLAKTISYNHVHRSLHFFFFDRATARQYQNVQVPFNRNVYRLASVHRPDTGSVWMRQLAHDGTRKSPQRQYEVDIYNITRFTDIGRIEAYLQQNITAKFELDDLDTCRPESRTSVVWRLTVHTAECPEFLRSIVRIIWFGRPLVLKHPSVRGRLLCLRCGNIGHTMGRCRYTDIQLKGSGSRVAKDKEVEQLEDRTKPFTTMEEVKSAAAKRLEIQKVELQAAQAALSPDTEVNIKGRLTTSQQEKKSSTREDNSDQDSRKIEVQPEPKTKWVTKPLRNGRTLYTHAASFQDKFRVDPSKISVLDEEDTKEFDEGISEPIPNETKGKPIEIDSEDELEEKAPIPISAAAKAKLHLVGAKAPKLRPPPQRVGLKQRERKALLAEVRKVHGQIGQIIRPTTFSGQTLQRFQDIELSLELQQVNTPATGNCLAMALAQALTDCDLAAQSDSLEVITSSLKQGIKWTGQLHLHEQFDHYTRKATLLNVDRGWDAMEPHEIFEAI